MRVFLALFSVLAVFILLVGGGALWYASGQLRADQEAHETEIAESFARHHSAFVEDQRLFEALAPFPEAAGASDAGPFLNPRLPWDGRSDALERWRETHAEEPPPLRLPDAEDDVLGGADWLEASPVYWRYADASWMAELNRFAYWDLEQTGPASLIDDDAYDWAVAPLPMYRPLMLWSKIRLLQGLDDGKPAEAALEVRHLARLLYSTENLIGGFVGLELLRHERQFFEHLSDHDHDLPDGWEPPSEASIDRFRRALWAANAYRNIDTPAEHRDQVLSLGRCTSLAESGWTALMIRPFLIVDHREAYGWLGSTLRESDCRLTRLRRAWDMPEDRVIASLRSDVCQSEDPTCTLQGWLRIPAVRRYVGRTFRSLGALDWFQRYED